MPFFSSQPSSGFGFFSVTATFTGAGVLFFAAAEDLKPPEKLKEDFADDELEIP